MSDTDTAVHERTAKTFFQLGMGYDLTGEYDEAIYAFYHALRIKPDMNEARMHLILLHTLLGDADEAVKQCAALKRYDEELAQGLLDSLKLAFG